MEHQHHHHNRRPDGKPIRVYFDGCFDCLHFGHVNALRRAREMGDYLVVGIHSDEDITKHKGRPPVCPEAERYRLIHAVKWADEVVEDASYLPDVELLERLNCDFCVHGDDQSFNADGGNSYRFLKEAGRFKEFKRTPGISTTDIIRRLLLTADDISTTENIQTDWESNSNSEIDDGRDLLTFPSVDGNDVSGRFPMSDFLTKFSSASGIQRSDRGRVVYIAGDFDLITVGYLEMLEKARSEGDHLIVGVHSDEVVKSYRGNRFPVLSLVERALTLLAFRCVSEVVIGVPLLVTEELVERLHVNVVCQGRPELFPSDPSTKSSMGQANNCMLKFIDFDETINNSSILERIKRYKDIYVTI